VTRVLSRIAIQAPLGYPWTLDCMIMRSFSPQARVQYVKN
jgi:hypothetical protein